MTKKQTTYPGRRDNARAVKVAYLRGDYQMKIDGKCVSLMRMDELGAALELIADELDTRSNREAFYSFKDASAIAGEALRLKTVGERLRDGL